MENKSILPTTNSADTLSVILETHRLSVIEQLSLDKFLSYELATPVAGSQQEMPGFSGDPTETSDEGAGGGPAIYRPPSGVKEYKVGNLPEAWGGYKNGKIPLSAMTSIAKRGDNWYGGLHYLRPDAASAWTTLKAKARAEGFSVTVSSAYRSYEHQASIPGKRKARPGHSNHGLGLAVDIRELYFNSQGTQRDIQQAAKMRETKLYKWLDRVGPEFGWHNPAKMRDGKGLEEPWHMEFYGIPKN